MKDERKTKRELIAELQAARDQIRELESESPPTRPGDPSPHVTPPERTSREVTSNWLEQAQRMAHVGSFTFDPNTGEGFWSRELYHIHGMDPDKPSPGRGEMFGLFHPEDAPRVGHAIETAVHQHTPFELTARILRPDGEQRCVQIHVRAELADDGSVKHILGAVQDITERRCVEKKLRESEEKFRSLYENSSIGLYRTTPDGEILLQNPALSRMLGFKDGNCFSRNLEDAQYFAPDYSREEFRKKLEEEGEIRGLESVWRHQDGSFIYVRENAHCVRDRDGGVLYYEGTVEDITEHKLAEQALAESERRFRLIADNIEDLVWRLEKDLTISFVSPSVEKLLGYSIQEALNLSVQDYFTEESLQKAVVELSERSPENPSGVREYEFVRKDGSIVPVEIHSTTVFDEEGKPDYTIGVTRDISRRLQAEKELRQSVQKYRELVDQTADGVVLADENGVIIEWNRAQEELTGLSRDRVIGRAVWDVQHEVALPEDRAKIPLERLRELVQLALVTGEAPWDRETTEVRILHQDGQARHVEQRAYLIRADGGYRIGSVTRDITEKKLVEEQLESERRFVLDIVDTDPNPIFVKNAGGKFLMANRALADLFEMSISDIVGKHLRDLLPNPDELTQYDQHDRRVLETGRPFCVEETYQDVQGQTHTFLTTKSPIRLQNGQTGVLGVSVDITDRMEAERAMRQAEREKSAILDSMAEMVALHDKNLEIQWGNRSAAESVGLQTDEIKGKRCFELWHHRDEPCEDCPVEKAFRTGRVETDDMATPDGRIWRLRAYPVLDDERIVQNVVEVGLDVTDQRRAQEITLEKSKLEGTATLAGGVAHDINNLMVGVMGNAELLQLDLGNDPEMNELLSEVIHAAEKAGNLAQEMLAFSRQGKYFPRALDVNTVIDNVYRSLLTSNPSGVRFVFDLHRELARIEADSSQLHMALMHVIRNAVEAIPETGTVRVETKTVAVPLENLSPKLELEPGDHVHIRVTDTGTGMAPEVRARVFEPMFSTKFTGRGMGMAAVYGIVKHHGGDIAIVSERDKGTRVDLYFPARISPAEVTPQDKPTIRASQEETVLLINQAAEDDLSLNHMLTRLGYNVHVTADREWALAFLEATAQAIDLVVLNCLRRPDDLETCLQQVRAVRDSLPLLACYSSEDGGKYEDGEIPGLHVLKKPFPLPLFSQTLRRVLNDPFEE